ncbi:hypothetical protein SY88_03520 [Clostridiales bacterium PH28_bin88]|nr:hypothetical protein SY88_03520 [Clostridiales bacterium PH28_bin88]
MRRIPCEVEHCLHHQAGNTCELETIHITANGLDTNCGDFRRKLPEGETTTVFSLGKADDTLETLPYD